MKMGTFSQIFSFIPKDKTKNIICTMDDVRGDFLGPPHGITPAAVMNIFVGKVKYNTRFILLYILHSVRIILLSFKGDTSVVVRSFNAFVCKMFVLLVPYVLFQMFS